GDRDDPERRNEGEAPSLEQGMARDRRPERRHGAPGGDGTEKSGERQHRAREAAPQTPVEDEEGERRRGQQRRKAERRQRRKGGRDERDGGQHMGVGQRAAQPGLRQGQAGRLIGMLAIGIASDLPYPPLLRDCLVAGGAWGRDGSINREEGGLW